ncbi:FkbM family methyltransferase [Actinotalea ferrariae]|uniref:FkbM family methyltransferase n=1 Tax=Actinotalea ferrariae TaxID=1386098 RepID=UPI001C8B9D71|nr:FkbM family methyltransferase [Actinotalea ferrariae]MBX9243460.1 FkbM family methyltransferase [Actinotalea ferrariae]
MSASPADALRRTTDRARGLVARGLSRSAAAVDLLEMAGAHTLADRLDRRRAGGEVVALRLPADVHDVRSHRVKALRRAGTDQCVEAFHQGGWWGYERPLPDVFLATLRGAPGVVLDVGANTGVYSLIASTVRGASVHAFEAFPPVAALLRENLALNRTSARVTVVDRAVSDSEGSIELFVPPDSGLVETSSSIDAGFKEGSTPITVPTVTLDAYWTSLGRPPVTLVKIDVEGAEHRVLAGAHELVGRARPVLFLEVLPGAHFEDLEVFLGRHGLVDVRLSQWEAVVGDAVIHHGLAWNHAFVPAERLEEFLAPLPRLGLKVTRLDG